ncbi:MAG: hypothetical protein PUB12_00735 [[Clostridium] aminophilum]|uniref:hypothetical protein n=1 Tax=[Clostridium] aminophilum TaxID=1526 RepID=UPI0026F1A1E5|nr:hypothetical protein [[Clostridium] aminophilum]MDD6195421.1 hypothetical protein [[Clostridium] aminophilum]
MHKIKLSNGRTISGLGLNGNNFISDHEIADSLFDGGLEDVEITNEESGEVQHMKNAFLVQNQQYGSEWWFILEEKTAEQVAREKMEAIITDVQVGMADIYEMIIK